MEFYECKKSGGQNFTLISTNFLFIPNVGKYLYKTITYNKILYNFGSVSFIDFFKRGMLKDCIDFFIQQVMSSVKVMTANRLKTNGKHWFDSISLQNDAGIGRQWITLEPRFGTIWHIKQLPGITRKKHINKQFAVTGALWSTREIHLYENNVTFNETDENSYDMAKSEMIARLRTNVTTIEQFRRLMRGYNHETPTTENEEQSRILTYRGDLGKVALPFGVIDAKIVLADVNGIETFEAISGPSTLGSKQSFQWSKTFPNVSHVGQPDVFNFDSVTPLWIWL